MATETVTIDSKDADHAMWFIEGASYYKVLKTVCELELFDELLTKPCTAADLAESKGWNLPYLERIMDVCIGMKFLEKAKNDEGKFIYRVLGPGTKLLKNGPPSLWEFVTSGTISEMLGNLTDKVKNVKTEGQSHHHGHSHHHHHHHDDGHGHGHHHGHHGDQTKDGEKKEDWNLDMTMYRMMEGMGHCYLKPLIARLDCSKYKTAVDLGAGTGIAGVTLLKHNEHMSVTLVDNEHSLKTAKEHFLPAELNNKITYLPGDIFELDLPTADMFIGSMVVHHLSDHQLSRLLKTLMEKLNPGGAVALFDMCLDDNKDGPLMELIWNLPQETHDQPRTGSHFIRLLQDTGFVNIKITKTQEMYKLLKGYHPDPHYMEIENIASSLNDSVYWVMHSVIS